MKVVKEILSVALFLSSPAWAAVRPETNAAFDQYVENQAHQRAREQGSGCDLWIQCSPGLQQRAMAGEIIVKPLIALLPGTNLRVPGGEINDTVGAMFLRGETIARARTVLEDYARFPEIYGPEIVEAKVQSNGMDTEVSIRLRKHFAITVAIDMLCRVHSTTPDAAHAVEHTTAIRIQEAKDPNRPEAGDRSPEEERGFLWRYESYWRMEETEQGLLVEHQMISLSRRAPGSLQFLLRPILSKLPRESMYRSLVATRQGLQER